MLTNPAIVEVMMSLTPTVKLSGVGLGGGEGGSDICA
jgi:hypothetical protein